jgi:hypothetical protein
MNIYYRKPEPEMPLVYKFALIAALGVIIGVVAFGVYNSWQIEQKYSVICQTDPTCGTGLRSQSR